MRVLDLFCGRGGWSAAFIDRGHEVFGIDIDPKFGADLTADILTLGADDVLWHLGGAGMGWPNVILASPPCEGFSVASIGHSWEYRRACRCGGQAHRTGTHRGGTRKWECDRCDSPVTIKASETVEPITETAKRGLQLVERTLQLIDEIAPTWWWLENPRAMMRRVEALQDVHRTTVTYCKYGETRMKPTDLWGVWPKHWQPRPACANGDPCHESAPRGSRTGTQGITGSDLRAIVPYELSLEVCLSCEAALAGEPPPPEPEPEPGPLVLF